MGKLTKNESRSLILLSITSLFDGITQGILVLQETIAKKALFATDFQVSLIGVLANGTMIFSFFISYYFANKNKKTLIILGYLFGRAVFLLSFLITNSKIFLIFLFFYHGLFSIQVPVFNSFLQTRFEKNRGYVFGITRMILILFIMITSNIVGKILEISAGYYKLILSLISIPSFLTYLIYLILESKNSYDKNNTNQLIGILGNFNKIFENKDFIFFEISFMIYGFAFMIMVPAVPIYLIKKMNFSYSEMSFVQGILGQIVILLITPFIGRLYDKINVWKVGTFSFIALVFYPLFFTLSAISKTKGFVYSGFLAYSLGLSGVNVLWNVGSITFSKKEGNSFLYQGFHVSLTGIRGIIGPLIGYLILSKMGLIWNFILAIFLFGIAAIVNSLYSKKAIISNN